MRVLLTGATGFIGRHVLDELRTREVEVVALARDASRLAATGVRVVELDLACAPDDLYRRLGRPEVAIHLAWGGLPNYRSLHHYETELPAQYRFLKQLVLAGLPALFAAGTCFEYGMQSGALAETLPARPGNPYGFAKETLRRELEFLKATSPFRLTWGRLFYTFGAGQPASSLYPLVTAALARGDAVFDMSGGEQLRDYLPVREVARLIVELALSGGDHGTVNIASGTPVSVRKLVEGWLAERGSQLQLNLGKYPYPDYEPMAFWGDTAKLRGIIRSDT